MTSTRRLANAEKEAYPYFEDEMEYIANLWRPVADHQTEIIRSDFEFLLYCIFHFQWHARAELCFCSAATFCHFCGFLLVRRHAASSSAITVWPVGHN